MVVDPHYGERIRCLPVDEPAWVVDSPDNYSIVRAVWKERQTRDQSAGLTAFTFDASARPDDWLIAELAAIDLHHGEYSHDPPYSIINVIGAAWSQKVQDELAKLGFFAHEATPEGFIARRDLSQRRPVGR